MSARNTIANYSDHALKCALEFLQRYRPGPREGQWCKHQLIMIKAEIEQRAKQDQIGLL